jgi:hypothetical protein
MWWSHKEVADQGATSYHLQTCTMFPSLGLCHRKIGGALSVSKWGLGNPTFSPKNSQNFFVKAFLKVLGFLD